MIKAASKIDHNVPFSTFLATARVHSIDIYIRGKSGTICTGRIQRIGFLIVERFKSPLITSVCVDCSLVRVGMVVDSSNNVDPRVKTAAAFESLSLVHGYTGV